jgi:hypothetical protein
VAPLLSLQISADLIGDGSELLLLVPAWAGIVGSCVVPALGAVPDAAMVLFSGPKNRYRVFLMRYSSLSIISVLQSFMMRSPGVRWIPCVVLAGSGGECVECVDEHPAFIMTMWFHCGCGCVWVFVCRFGC